MRLLELSANRSTFRAVKFNDAGISLIVGRKGNPEGKEIKKTYNGVGKSLIIRLVHFCLGCNSIESFREKLPDWEFILTFEVAGSRYVAARSTDDQSKMSLNGELLSVNDFKAFFEPLVFSLQEPFDFLKFRPLVSRFIRPTKKNYNSFNEFVTGEQPYAELLCNGFLLGLDINRISQKRRTKVELDKLKDTEKRLEKDELLKSYFIGNEDINVGILDIEEKVNSLETRLRKYEVAEDYYSREQAADSFKKDIKQLSNRLATEKAALASINKSLKAKADIAPSKVIQLYAEIGFSFREELKRQLGEVDEFHKEITTRREERLSHERNGVEARIGELQLLIARAQKSLDQQMTYLGTHRALDEYATLAKQLASEKAALENLTKYREVIVDLKKRALELKQELARMDQESHEYLEKSSSILDGNRRLFRNYSKEFYEDKPGGIDVKNNEGENQIRFSISAKIEDDASDGINEVKIFCFDSTLLNAKHNHRVDFIFHDSRLFSDMDPRQRATLFKVAHGYTKDNSQQYIATVNEDMLESMKEWLSEAEFEEIIRKNVVLELTDESAAKKLLGIQIDLDYDE